MYCQVCGARNHDDAEYCARCQQKLLVLSGLTPAEETIETPGDGFSFDEHLLERISILEEVLKRTGETVRNLLGAMHKQEENILINHAGLQALRDLLEQKDLIGAEEWSHLWESRMEDQFLALEKRDRFVACKDKIAALYEGDKPRVFLQLLEEAEYGLYAANLEKAVLALEAALKLDRSNYELAHYLGESYFHEGRLEAALSHFRLVLEQKPDHYDGLVYGGVAHHQLGASERAEELLKRAVALYPDAFLPHFSLGAVFAGQGNLTKAAVFLERAVEIDSVPQAMYLLSNCLYEMGKLRGAIRHAREAVRLDPAFEECYHLLGLCYLDRSWNRKALDAFRQAQHLNPKRMRYQDLVLFLSGQSVMPLPEVGDEAAQFVGQAEKAMAGPDASEALSLYRRALEHEPDNPTLLMSYALACLNLDRNHEIRQVTKRVIELDPGEMLTATAYATLIESLRSEGKYREGNRFGRRLLDEGTSNFSKSIAYYEMAFNLAEMDEDLDEALDFARRSLEYSPEELRQFPLAALGWVHYKREEFGEAIDFLSKSTELGSSSETLTHLGMALIASGEEDRARDILDQARQVAQRGSAIEEKMMEFMQDSSRILRRVRRRDS